MVADAFPSKAMKPGVVVYYGYQAGCNAEECATDEVGVWLGETFQRWWGDFWPTWIEARLDALTHNIEKHPTPALTWEEIIMDTLKTDCARCGITDVLMTNREAITHDANCRRRKGLRRAHECVIHFQPDCSPLLNACSRLTSPAT